jgi:hypothetical protein
MALQMSWDEILKSTAITYVNRGLTLLAVYLAQHGLRADSVLTSENLLILAGAIVTAGIDLAITLYRKKSNHNLIEAARFAPAGASMSVIKADAAALPIVGKG